MTILVIFPQISKKMTKIGGPLEAEISAKKFFSRKTSETFLNTP
jgi:hypothetical protein